MNWGKWIHNILVGIDQFANTIIGGDPDETISSRAGKARRKGKWWARALCWGLNVIDRGHCEDSVDETEGGDQVFDD
ncbi:MAG: hypothetical protein IIA72_18950 [Proteobacteria bacterium]|nr:hypothetical protein [Pseudomonadota bacterium]